jgi:UDP-glucuronate decarboxylase
MIETEILTENANEILERVDLSKMEGKSILVTGSSGIIGLYILYSLYLFKKRFHIPIEVTGVVYNELPSYLEFLKQSGFKFMRGNLADASFSAKLPNADIIVHAATYGQPGQYLIDKIGTLRLNTSLTLDLLEKVNSGGSFLFMSSSSVYIGLTHVPFNENEIGISNTNHYRSCYIEGKRCGEAICEAYKDKGINAKSVRLSLAYGPGTKIERTYCFISDAVSMILNILIFGKESIYNVGGVSDTTIAEIGKMIGEKLDVPVIIPKDSEDSIISKGAPIDDKLDLGRYVGEFGDVNFISLDEGLDRTIRWQKEIFKRK